MNEYPDEWLPTLGALDDESAARIRRYLMGAASAADRRWVEEWAAENPHRRELLERARATREQRFPSANPTWDTDAAWQRLRARIAAGEVEKVTPLPRRTTQRRPHRQLVRIAAAMVMVLGAGLLWMQLRPSQDQLAVEIREVRTAAGEQRRVRLADGTLVSLGPESRLRYPARLADTLRTVTLEGEAYFDVPTIDHAPFQVRTTTSLTRVLGTEFALRSRPEEGYVEVVVAEGRVAFGSAVEGEPRRVELTRGYAARLSGNGSLTPPRRVDLGRALAWLQGVLVFADAPMSEVVSTLERRFGIQIMVAEPSVASMRLTAEIRSDDPSEVLRLICLSLGLSCTERDGTYTLDLPAAGEPTSTTPGL